MTRLAFERHNATFASLCQTWFERRARTKRWNFRSNDTLSCGNRGVSYGPVFTRCARGGSVGELVQYGGCPVFVDNILFLWWTNGYISTENYENYDWFSTVPVPGNRQKDTQQLQQFEVPVFTVLSMKLKYTSTDNWQKRPHSHWTQHSTDTPHHTTPAPQAALTPLLTAVCTLDPRTSHSRNIKRQKE